MTREYRKLANHMLVLKCEIDLMIVDQLGLIWINLGPKKQKKQKKQCFGDQSKDSPDPSSPENIVFFVFFGPRLIQINPWGLNRYQHTSYRKGML